MIAEKVAAEVVISPAKIMQVGFGFWSSKVLLTAVKLNLFTQLSDGNKTAADIKTALGLHDRGLYDFLDTLVALGFLHREGTGETARYCNTLETEVFLDKRKPSYVGGILEMSNDRLYPFWSNLEVALQTGEPQNEAKNGGAAFFDELYAKEERLEGFIAGMAGIQNGNFTAFARKFDFSRYKTHCDIGGAGGNLAARIAVQHPGIRSATFDLPQVAPIAQRHIESLGLADRVSVLTGNFFTDAFPKADVITMGNILHDWNLEQKKALIQKAYDALPEGGAFAVLENIIDDARKENAFGLLMSLNMLIETPGGFDYTAADFAGWAKEAGFARIDVLPLTGPASALVAYK